MKLFYKKTLFSLLITLLCLCFPYTATQSQAETADTFQIRLQELSARLEKLRLEDKINAQLFEQAVINVQTKRLQRKNLQLELSGVQREIEEKTTTAEQLREEIHTLQQQAVAPEEQAALNGRIDSLRTALKQNSEKLALLQEQHTRLSGQLSETELQLRLDTEWLKWLRPLYQYQHRQDLEQEADNKRRDYLTQAAGLRTQLENLPDDKRVQGQKDLLQSRILDAEERALAVLDEVRLQQAKNQFEQLSALLHDNIHPQSTELKTVDKLLENMQENVTHLQDKLEVLNTHAQVIAKQDIENIRKKQQQLIDGLIELRQTQLQTAQTLLPSLQALDTDLRQAYTVHRRSTLYSRRELPSGRTEWDLLGSELGRIPFIFKHQMQSVLRTAKEDFAQVSVGLWLGIIASTLLWLILLWRGQKYFHRRLQDKTMDAAPLYSSWTVFLRLADENTSVLALSGALLLPLWVIQPAQSTVWLFVTLILLWLAVKLPLNLARLLLSELDIPGIKHNPALYRQLRWILILSGVFTTVALLAHFMPFPQMVLEFIDTLFMLFLSITALPVLHIRKMGVEWLDRDMKNHRWLPLIRVVSLLFPLSLLAVGVLGVIGYINLGWVVAQQLSWFIAVLSGWLILRSLLGDAVNYLKNYALQHSHDYGLLWTQDILPLLSKIIRIGLLFSAVLLLLKLNGQEAGEWFSVIVSYELLKVGESQILLSSFLWSLFALYAVFWLGGWVRRVTYRWIYAGVSDLGVRHSLSVFTQYAILLVGGLITLRILGLDLTTFTVFAGALGVGLGFGLQNIANNFVSGLLLLAERPLRTGDLVNIGGTYEGKVTQIGVRSLTVKTWDNQDLIVPNSELISKAFTNWTRTDPILRTVFLIGVSYGSDLDKVKELLLDIIKNTPNIALDQEYDVHLTDFADSAILFRVHYHVDINLYSGIKTKSDVLFEIWRRFNQENIEIPFPQRDIHIKTQAGT